MNEHPLSEQHALELWQRVEPQLAQIIVKAINKMGLPALVTYAPRDGQLRANYFRDVKSALLRDEHLHDDAVTTTAVEFWKGVKAGKFRADSNPGLIARIAQRTARRLATKCAAKLLAEVSAVDQNASVFDAAATTSPHMQELALDLLRDWNRLLPHLRRLEPDDFRILMASLENSYDELEAELGIKRGALRTRACRLRKTLRAAVIAERDGKDRPRDDINEKGSGRAA